MVFDRAGAGGGADDSNDSRKRGRPGAGARMRCFVAVTVGPSITGRVADTAARLRAAVDGAGVGIGDGRCEKFRATSEPATAIRNMRDLDPGTDSISEVGLFESELGPGGARYARLAGFGLAAKVSTGANVNASGRGGAAGGLRWKESKIF